MDVRTGQIYYGTAQELEARDAHLIEQTGNAEPLIPLAAEQAERMKLWTPDMRRGVANRVRKRRAKNRAAKLSRRSNR